MKQAILKFLADLRFAILMLLLIAISSVIGTIIEQDQAIEVYKLNYPVTDKIFNFLSWDVILFFGFDHIYKTWWFTFLILLFGISLLTCTTIQQVPALKIARRCQFFRSSKQFNKLKLSSFLAEYSFNKILVHLKTNNYSIFQQKNLIYSYKGLIGKLAPIIVHFSMILILFGTFVSALSGFKAQEIIPKTETFHIQNVLNTGQLTQISKTSARVNDFWITYSKTSTINQFYSDISILNNNGSEIKRKTIYVNSPIIYNGIKYYQTDWNLVGLRLKKNNLLNYQYPLVSLFDQADKFWISWLPLNNNFLNLKEGFVILINSLQGYCSIYDQLGSFVGNIELNENSKINFPFSLIDIISSTGLQIKMDSGIPLIYTGFGCLMLSTLISYITYSQIWIVYEQKMLFIGGNTTRATLDFELEFFKLTN